MTADYFAAEDLAQETFLSAYEHFRNFDGSNPKAWLCRIATNKCIDYILLWNGNGAKCDVVGTKIMLDFNKGDIKRASDHIPVLVDVKF